VGIEQPKKNALRKFKRADLEVSDKIGKGAYGGVWQVLLFPAVLNPGRLSLPCELCDPTCSMLDYSSAIILQRTRSECPSANVLTTVSAGNGAGHAPRSSCEGCVARC
jgi:hypothetical protein